MEKRKSGLQWWFNLSISRKTLLMQSVIIFLPLAILVYFLLSVSYMDRACCRNRLALYPAKGQFFLLHELGSGDICG